MEVDVRIIRTDDASATRRIWWETVAFTIPDVDPRDAPVAATFRHRHQRWGQDETDFRIWNGRLWREGPQSVVDMTIGDRRVAGQPMGLQEWHPLRSSNPAFDGGSHGLMDKGQVTQHVPARDTEAVTRERVANTIAIEGRYHTLAAGPMIEAGIDRGGQAALQWVMYASNPTGKARHLPFWDRARAEDIMREVSGKDPVWVGGTNVRFEIDPPAGLHDATALAMEGAAINLFAGLKANYLRGDMRGMKEFADIREAYVRRWPHMEGYARGPASRSWLFEQDRVDFPETGELGRMVADASDEVIEMLQPEHRFAHRFAKATYERDPRYTAALSSEDDAALSGLSR